MSVLILGILFGIGIQCYHVFSYGYVTYIFYGWFVLPMIPQLPHFTVLQFVGFILFLSVLRPESETHLKDEFKDQMTMWLSLIINPWLMLFLGWIVHSIWF